MDKPYLIAHRGYASRYPENTCLAIEKAIDVGARYVEFDVQLTADGVPMVFHDAELKRTTGVEGRIMDFTSRELAGINANEEIRFGKKFGNVPIPTLASVAALLEKRPNVTAFVEIKQESLDLFGIPRVISAVIQVIAPVKDRCVIISYNVPAVRSARANGITKIGLVLTAYDESSRSVTEALNPEFVICNYKKLPPPPAALWTGRWQWALYEFDDPELALTWSKRGVEFIETMAVGDLLKHPKFRQGANVADESV